MGLTMTDAQSNDVNIDELKMLLESINKTKNLIDNEGVTKSYNFFEDASNKYDIFSIKWAKITFSLFFITFALSFYNFYFMNDIPADGYELAVFISKRLFIFALLIYSIIFSGRIYMANWHNYVINKHKQNALQTFLGLVTATNDQDKKDIILTFAANCIYTQQETGFSNEKSAGTGSPAEQIAKLAEAINKAQKKSSD